MPAGYPARERLSSTQSGSSHQCPGPAGEADLSWLIMGMCSAHVTIKLPKAEAEGQFTDFWLNIKVPWTARRSNQSILKEITEYSLQGLMLKLKLQHFGYLMWKADSLEKTLTPGKPKGRRGWQKMRWLNSIADSVDMSLSKLQEIVKDREAWRSAVHGVTKSLTWLSD